jgi:hypothetical protein
MMLGLLSRKAAKARCFSCKTQGKLIFGIRQKLTSRFAA